MKRQLIALLSMVTFAIGTQYGFAACPISDDNPCDNSCESESCKEKKGCCEDWLYTTNLEEYFCKMNLSDNQKSEAIRAIEEFKDSTQSMRNSDCTCSSKEECREYRRALRTLDNQMKNIITKCQKNDYKAIRKEVKDQVKLCHHCLIGPSPKCKSTCD